MQAPETETISTQKSRGRATPRSTRSRSLSQGALCARVAARPSLSPAFWRTGRRPPRRVPDERAEGTWRASTVPPRPPSPLPAGPPEPTLPRTCGSRLSAALSTTSGSISSDRPRSRWAAGPFDDLLYLGQAGISREETSHASHEHSVAREGLSGFRQGFERPSGKWDIGPAFEWDAVIAGVQA